jgi:hypothetical protein
MRCGERGIAVAGGDIEHPCPARISIASHRLSPTICKVVPTTA